MTEPTPTTEGVASTLQDYLRVAAQTTELGGTHIEFTRDGVTWVDLLLDGEPPAAARAIVHRKGETIPTRVTAIWGESLPIEGEWRDLWLAKPHALFGAFVLRAAFRRAFPDVLGDRREPDEHGALPATSPAEPTPSAAPAADVEAERIARIHAADTLDEVDAVHAEAKEAKQITQPLHNAARHRRREIREALAAAEANAEAAAPATDEEPPTAMQLAMREAEQRAAAERDAAPKPTAPKRRATRKQD